MRKTYSQSAGFDGALYVPLGQARELEQTIVALERERDELRSDFEHEKRLLWAAKEQIAEQQLRIPTPGTLTRIEKAEARVAELEWLVRNARRIQESRTKNKGEWFDRRDAALGLLEETTPAAPARDNREED